MEKAAYLWGFRCRQFYKVFVEIVRGLGSNLFQTKKCMTGLQNLCSDSWDKV